MDFELQLFDLRLFLLDVMAPSSVNLSQQVG